MLLSVGYDQNHYFELILKMAILLKQNISPWPNELEKLNKTLKMLYGWWKTIRVTKNSTRRLLTNL